VKTPGGKLSVHYIKKQGTAPKCGECGAKLNGVVALRPKAMRTTKQRQRKVYRAYGGSLCAGCVRKRVIRAFLIEEQAIVKAVLRTRKSQEKAAEKVAAEKKAKAAPKKGKAAAKKQ